MSARRIRLAPIAVLVAAAPLRAQYPTPPTSPARITETPMGPLVMGSQMARTFFSEDGSHLAIIAAKGSRQVVWLDGVEGPPFDEIPNFVAGSGQLAVSWSATGGHSGYVGRRGGDFIAVIDGKEVGAVVTQQLISSGAGGAEAWQIWFNRDGTKNAYAVIPEAGAWVMMENGVKSPIYKSIDFKSVRLRGSRLAYVVQSLDSQFHVVVDGKVGPAYAAVRGLTLTPDGAHYAYLTQRGGAGGLTMTVVNDGVEGKPFAAVDQLEQAPDGRVAYVATFRPADVTRTSGPGGLVVSGLVVPNVTTFNSPKPGGYYNGAFTIQSVAWSADGKRAAYVVRDPSGGSKVMVNGTAMGPTYTGVNDVHWSPDGGHLAYVATSPTGTFPVIDGQELAAFGMIFEISFGADGSHSLILGNAAGGVPTALLDGKPQPKALGFGRTPAVWSPDGKHVAWAAQTTGGAFAALVDGVPRPGNLGNFMAINQVQPQITFPEFLWSADGAHLAYVGVRSDGTGRSVVYVDNTTYEGPSPSYTLPGFSPDGKHFATVMTTGKGWLVLLDGKVSPAYESILMNTVTAARFTGPTTYRFYGVKAGQIYRVTLDL